MRFIVIILALAFSGSSSKTHTTTAAPASDCANATTAKPAGTGATSKPSGATDASPTPSNPTNANPAPAGPDANPAPAGPTNPDGSNAPDGSNDNAPVVAEEETEPECKALREKSKEIVSVHATALIDDPAAFELTPELASWETLRAQSPQCGVPCKKVCDSIKQDNKDKLMAAMEDNVVDAEERKVITAKAIANANAYPDCYMYCFSEWRGTTAAPTEAPTPPPTNAPTSLAPTNTPTPPPTNAPTPAPTNKPSVSPITEEQRLEQVCTPFEQNGEKIVMENLNELIKAPASIADVLENWEAEQQKAEPACYSRCEDPCEKIKEDNLKQTMKAMTDNVIDDEEKEAIQAKAIENAKNDAKCYMFCFSKWRKDEAALDQIIKGGAIQLALEREKAEFEDSWMLSENTVLNV